ncbi:MAG: hypothetical protein Q7S21_06040 [archaeon]|nr:hypothetical protein [archaeon]
MPTRRKPLRRRNVKSSGTEIPNAKELRLIADHLRKNIKVGVDIKDWNDKAHVKAAFDTAIDNSFLMLHSDQRERMRARVHALLR